MSEGEHKVGKIGMWVWSMRGSSKEPMLAGWLDRGLTSDETDSSLNIEEVLCLDVRGPSGTMLVRHIACRRECICVGKLLKGSGRS